jgi:hypothetical protein
MAILNANPGDAIPIPAETLGVQGYVLSRVLYRNPVTVVEVFGGFSEGLPWKDNRLHGGCLVSDRMFAPVFASFDFNKHFGKVPWPILSMSGDADLQHLFNTAEFAEVGYAETGRYFRGAQRCQEPPDVRRPLEGTQIYSNPQLILRVNLHLNGVLAPMEPLTPARTRQLMAIQPDGWWEAELARCKSLSDQMADAWRRSARTARLPTTASRIVGR